MTEFNEKVWALTKKIPKGKISTYSEIAKALDCKAYRAVGNALNKNPFSAWGWIGNTSGRRQDNIVPCHRVVKSNGEIGGFAHGTRKKILMLRKEGIKIREGKIVNFQKVLKKF